MVLATQLGEQSSRPAQQRFRVAALRSGFDTCRVVVLVIAADSERREWIAERLAARGLEVRACHPRRASLAVREAPPDGLAIDVADAGAARRVLARARAAA
ncbi:MAG: hypothetical protein FJ035_05690, partial [Chloroflexi bacterium]|nr:hypothetical protein [Chloroflexota bacterium]